jgi:hypothetical protein
LKTDGNQWNQICVLAKIEILSIGRRWRTVSFQARIIFSEIDAEAGLPAALRAS